VTERVARELSIVRTVAAALTASLELPRVLGVLLDSLRESFGFEHAMILLVRPEGHLEVVASRGFDDGGIGARVEPGQGLVGVVAKNRRLIRMNGIPTQRNYAAGIGGGTAIRLPGLQDARSSVAVPMMVGDDLVGVLAVESRKPLSFLPEDEALVTNLANLAAAAVRNALLFDALQRKHHELLALNEAALRFVPLDFIAALGGRSLADVERGRQVHRRMAVSFSDIRGFTSISERLSPDEVFALVNEYFAAVEPAIRASGGFIDKYIGDAVMSLFDGDSPESAVRAALLALDALDVVNRGLAARGLPAIDMGVGIHVGDLTLGTVGSPDRLTCTVHGDTVNLASRVEGLTRMYQTRVLVTGDCAAMLPDGAFSLREVDRARVKGRRKPVALVEVLDALPPALRERREAQRGALSEGLEAWRAGDLARAEEAFRRMEGDPVAALYVARCAQQAAIGIPDGWDGTVTMLGKT
jgi:adenylate cyclase